MKVTNLKNIYDLISSRFIVTQTIWLIALNHSSLSSNMYVPLMQKG